MNEQENAQKEKRSERLGVSVPQVIAAALAALTAAFAASQLGVYGTTIGAGLMSLVTTVGAALYQRSIERTKDKMRDTVARVPVKTLRGESAVRVRPDEFASDFPEAPGQTTERADTERTRVFRPVTPGTYPGAGDDPQATQRIAKLGEPADPESDGEQPAARPRRRKLKWAVIAGTAALGFVIAMLGVSAFELGTGESISGNSRTSIGGLFQQGGEQGGQNQQDGPAETGDPDAPDQQDQPGEESGTTTTEAPQPTEQPTQDDPAPTQDPPREQQPAPQPAPAPTGGDGSGQE